VAPRLPRTFFARSSVEVAPGLLGHVLARRLPDGSVLRARIVETEAYEPDDPASHAFRGRTPRNATMFGPPGRLYVYFTYGMHFCMNVVTRAQGQGSAVLLRAGEPLEGLDAMAERRRTGVARDLCRGPARWTQAFGVDRDLDGEDLVRSERVWLERGSVVGRIATSPRVGIRVGTDRPWRFAEAECRWTSGRAALSPSSARAPSRP